MATMMGIYLLRIAAKRLGKKGMLIMLMLPLIIAEAFIIFFL